MAINVTQLAANKATKTVEFAGQTTDITYRPGLITQERLEKVVGDTAIMEFLVDVLVSWDIRVGQKKLPISIASLKKLPFELVGALYEAVVTSGGEVSPEA